MNIEVIEEKISDILFNHFGEYGFPALHAISGAVRAERAAEESFKKAVIDALVVNHIYRAEHDTNPRLAIIDLIAWEVKIALDPAVSEAARSLIERGTQKSKLNENYGDNEDG